MGVSACRFCDNARINENLTDENDYSAISVGHCMDGFRMMFCSGFGMPPRFEIEQKRNNNNKEEMYVIGEYRLKYCPNCGRKIFEYERKND